MVETESDEKIYAARYARRALLETEWDVEAAQDLLVRWMLADADLDAAIMGDMRRRRAREVINQELASERDNPELLSNPVETPRLTRQSLPAVATMAPMTPPPVDTAPVDAPARPPRVTAAQIAAAKARRDGSHTGAGVLEMGASRPDSVLLAHFHRWTISGGIKLQDASEDDLRKIARRERANGTTRLRKADFYDAVADAKRDTGRIAFADFARAWQTYWPQDAAPPLDEPETEAEESAGE